MSAATSPNAVPNPLQPDVAALKATHRGSAEDGRKLINLILCCVDQLGCSTSHTAENISILTPTGARINSYHKVGIDTYLGTYAHLPVKCMKLEIKTTYLLLRTA